MSLRFRQIVATLIVSFASFALVPNAFAQNSERCKSEVQRVELEIDALEADAFGAIERAQAATDKCTRGLAAEQALRKGLDVRVWDLERALSTETKARILAEERERRAKTGRLLFFAGGAAVAGIVAVVLAIAL